MLGGIQVFLLQRTLVDHILQGSTEMEKERPLGTSSPDPDPFRCVFVSYSEVTVFDHVENPSCGGFDFR